MSFWFGLQLNKFIQSTGANKRGKLCKRWFYNEIKCENITNVQCVNKQQKWLQMIRLFPVNIKVKVYLCTKVGLFHLFFLKQSRTFVPNDYVESELASIYTSHSGEGTTSKIKPRWSFWSWLFCLLEVRSL